MRRFAEAPEHVLRVRAAFDEVRLRHPLTIPYGACLNCGDVHPRGVCNGTDFWGDPCACTTWIQRRPVAFRSDLLAALVALVLFAACHRAPEPVPVEVPSVIEAGHVEGNILVPPQTGVGPELPPQVVGPRGLPIESTAMAPEARTGRGRIVGPRGPVPQPVVIRNEHPVTFWVDRFQPSDDTELRIEVLLQPPGPYYAEVLRSDVVPVNADTWEVALVHVFTTEQLAKNSFSIRVTDMDWRVRGAIGIDETAIVAAHAFQLTPPPRGRD